MIAPSLDRHLMPSGQALPGGSQSVVTHLMSHVSRFAASKMLSRTSTVLEKAGYPHHNCFDIATNHLECLPRLADTIGCSLSDIEKLAHTSLRHLPTAQIVDFFGAEVPAYDLALRARRVAPHAITSLAGYPAIWTHGLIGFCPLTGEELLDRCPACEEKLGWRFVCEPWRCDQCGEDMRRTPAVVADPAKMVAAEDLLQLIAPNADLAAPSYEGVPDELRSLGRGAIFDLFWRLAMLESDASSITRARQSALSAVKKLDHAVCASMLMQSWPKSIENIIDKAASKAVEGDGRRFAHLKTLLLRVPHFPKIGDVISARWGLNRHARAVLGAIRSDMVYGKEAEQIVGVTASDFSLLARAGALPCLTEFGDTRPRRSYHRAELSQVRQTLDSAATIDDCAARLGLRPPAVEQLMCLGLIEPLEHKALDVLGRAPAARRHSLEAFLAMLRAGGSQGSLRDVRFIKSPISIGKLFRAIGGRDKPWGPMLQMLLTTDDIPFGFACNSADGSCRDIIISRDNAKQVLALTFDRTAFPNFAFSRSLDRPDLIEHLNLNPNSWDLADLLAFSPVETMARYPVDRSAIDAIGATYIDLHEIRARLLLLGLDLDQSLTRRWPGRTAAGWHRLDIERLIGLPLEGVSVDEERQMAIKPQAQLSLELS